MRTAPILMMFLLSFGLWSSGLVADNPEKAQKKELEAQVRAMTREAQGLESAGRLAEARAKYAESQALIEMQNVTDAIKRLDEEIKKRVSRALDDSTKFYEAKSTRKPRLCWRTA